MGVFCDWWLFLGSHFLCFSAMHEKFTSVPTSCVNRDLRTQTVLVSLWFEDIAKLLDFQILGCQCFWLSRKSDYSVERE